MSNFTSTVSSDEFEWKVVSAINEVNAFISLAQSVKEEYHNFSGTPANLRTGQPINLKVPFKVMWLIYPNGVCDDKSYTMTKQDIHMAYDTIAEFKRLLEEWSDKNVKIINEVKIVDRPLVVSKEGGAVPSPAHIKTEYDVLLLSGEYNCVITVTNIKTYLGVTYTNFTSNLAYCTISIQQGGENPLLWNTDVAIHEFLHTLETLGKVLDIIYPPTHAYIGDTGQASKEKYPGFSSYITCNPGSPIQRELKLHAFYKDVVKANVKYMDENDAVKYVGMFPSMWKYVAAKNQVQKTIGVYAIKTVDGQYLYADGNALKTRESCEDIPAYRWIIKANANGGFTITPENNISLYVDVGNASTCVGAMVNLWGWSGYIKAQTWDFVKTTDPNPSYRIATKLASNKFLGATEKGSLQLTESGDSNSQKWIFELKKTP